MKCKFLVAVIPFLFLAFNHDNGSLKNVYYSSLKSLNQADGPRIVNMFYSGRHTGQSMLESEGTLFTYKNRGARSVQIGGNFCGWKPAAMDRSDNGVWYYFLPAGENRREITYKYLVDGIWIMDPLNTDRIDDRMGSYLSVAGPVEKPEGTHVTWRKIGGNTIEFRLYKPGASLVSLVGDFNHWNPEDDLLAKGRDGIWRVRKKLFPGVYRYKFIIDGEWLPDTYNSESASDDTGEVCSIIEIKK
jgi:1,4-alpha-glucan branching enzyme